MVDAMGARVGRGQKNYAKKMSDNIAIALIVYTMMLIFVMVPAMNVKGMSIMPYLLLVLLVGLMVPFCRNIDKRWKSLMGSELSEGSIGTRYNIDRVKLWAVAIGIPIILTLLFKAF